MESMLVCDILCWSIMGAAVYEKKSQSKKENEKKKIKKKKIRNRRKSLDKEEPLAYHGIVSYLAVIREFYKCAHTHVHTLAYIHHNRHQYTSIYTRRTF